MSSHELITGADILAAVLLDAGELESQTGDYGTDAKRYVRETYWSLLGTDRWPWALSPNPGIITTLAKQDVSVVSISSATPAVVTLSSTIATSQTGLKFYMESEQSVYRVASHTASTVTLTLDAKYVEDVTSGPAVLYQDEYAYPYGVLKVWDPLWPRGWQHDPIKLWDKPTFEQRYGRGAWGFGSGIVEAACEIHPGLYAADPAEIQENMQARRIRIAPWSEDAINIEFDYTLFHDLDFFGSGSSDTPHVPREYRSAIAYGATFRLLEAKNDSRAGTFGQLYAGALSQMRELYIPQQHGKLHVQRKHSAALGCT